MKSNSATARFAVDFVILPPDHVMDIAISLNKRVCKASYILLDKDKCFPHVSLLMGCLRVDQVKEAEIILKSITSQYKAMTLSLTHMRTVKTSVGDVITLDIDPHKNLQLLHESLVKSLAPLLSQDATEDDLFGNSHSASTLDWVNSFMRNSCFENFWPHITIGYAKENAGSEKIEPFTFTASRLAICHLGDYCTCKKILTEARLAE